MCGEHDDDIMWNLHNFGSSPRVWGARVVMRLELSALRLIPTCVGSTAFGLFPGVVGAAHPHVCGEHNSFTILPFKIFGSSPRVWGALNNPLDIIPDGRLIPTCVGSTPTRREPENPRTAHPHVCGEHEEHQIMKSLYHGSSPRVWGAHLLTWDFIPTHQVLELV